MDYLPAWDADRARTLIEGLARLPGAMLPVLHRLQDEFGYLHEEAIPLVADALNVSRAEVVGVIHFYHDFRTEPPGRHVLKVCRAEACQSMGAEAVLAHVTSRLGVEPGATAPDGSVTLDAVYCLGNCALSPAAMLDGKLYGRVTAARADALLDRVVAP